MIKILLLLALLTNNLVQALPETSQAIIPYQAPLKLPTQEEINQHQASIILWRAQIFNTPLYTRALRAQERVRITATLSKSLIISRQLIQQQRELAIQKQREIAYDVNFSKVLWQEQRIPLDELVEIKKTEKNNVEVGSVSLHTILPTSKLYKEKTPFMYEEEIHTFVVHGTWSNPDSYGVSKEKPLTQQLIRFNKQLSAATKKPVIMHGFKWNGKLDKNDRSNAGVTLAQEIIAIETTRKAQRLSPAKYWFIGHSHGNNVTNNAALYLKNHGISIDTSIFIASPALDNCPIINHIDGTYNTTSLLNIFGRADLIGRLGSSWTTGLQSGTLRIPYASATTESVRNIAALHQYNHLNHKTIKEPIIKNLAQIITDINNPSVIVPGNIIINIQDNNIQIVKDPKDPLNMLKRNFEGIRTFRDYAGLSAITQQDKEVEATFRSKCGGSIFNDPNMGERVSSEIEPLLNKTSKEALNRIKNAWPDTWRSEDDINRRRFQAIKPQTTTTDFDASPTTIVPTVSSNNLNNVTDENKDNNETNLKDDFIIIEKDKSNTP